MKNIISFTFWLIAIFSLAETKAFPQANLNPAYLSIVSGSDEVTVRNATVDLQRYLAQVSGQVPTLISSSQWSENPVPAILIGEVDFIKKLAPGAVRKQDLGREGYLLGERIVKDNKCFVLCAEQPAGLVNSIYGFLREVGFEFNLSSEFAPRTLPEHMSQSTVVRKPVFNVRGVLPWYNFFNSPTTWDMPDHRAFVDQLIRSGANFITFHSYEHEPFIAVPEGDDMIFGGGLHNTSRRTWGTNSMSTSEFLYGTDKLFDTPYFGAETTNRGYDNATQIRKEKAVMHDALLYAKNRGLITSLGFAPLGDPTIKADRDRFIKEFTHNLEYYNFLDYIFIWQTETKGAQGHPLKYDQHVLPDARDPNSKIINYGQYRREEFKRIVEKESGIKPFFKPDEEGKIARATEGARLEMFAKIALRILSRYQNAPKIVIAGWGGENYLLSEEYYDGLDKVLPRDVAFSSLESLTPKTYIDKAYFELPADRQRWPIPWLENDGDQWHPQPFLKTYEPMIKDLKKSGSQGFLAIHWRTREVEDNFGYLLNYAWDPQITKDTFFEAKARRYPQISGSLKQIYLALDSLGYRWVGGRGQTECAVFTWGSGSVANYQRLSELRASLNELLTQVQENKDNLIWLRDRMDWVLDYQNAEMQAEQAKELLKKANEATKIEDKRLLAKGAFGILSGDALAKALHSYSERITTRGEYGVLATINAKAAFDWRKMYNEASEILGISLPLTSEWKTDSKIIVPRKYGSCVSGSNFEISAIVLGGKNATLKYRTLGTKKWEQLPMQSKSGWVQSAIIPANQLALPGFEYMIVTSETTDNNAYGPYAVSVIQPDIVSNVLSKKQLPVTSRIRQLSLETKKGTTVAKWDEIPSADYYLISVNGQKEIESPVPFYPFGKILGKGTKINVKAIQGETVIAEKEVNAH